VPERKLFPGSAQIIDLARARAGRAPFRRARRPVSSARSVLLVSLAIGLAAGVLLARLLDGNALTQFRNGVLLASGTLARALNEQLVGHAPEGVNIHVTATYRAKNGGYCRTFNVSGIQPLTGLACRRGEQWQVQALLSNANPSSPLELNRNISGIALPAAAEAQLRSHDWQ
jgi:hypothetical protein